MGTYRNAVGNFINTQDVDITGTPRLGVSPLLSAAATNWISLGVSGGTPTVYHALVVVDPEDDVVARDALLARGPGVRLLRPGETISISTADAMTSFAIIGIGSADDTANGIVAFSNTTAADWLTAARYFTVNAARARSVAFQASDLLFTAKAMHVVIGVGADD